jgi:hypothetical protein
MREEKRRDEKRREENTAEHRDGLPKVKDMVMKWDGYGVRVERLW